MKAFLKWLVYSLLPMVLGFWFALGWLVFLPQLLDYRSSLYTAVWITNPYLSAFMLYAIPVVVTYASARVLCRLGNPDRRYFVGACLVWGSLIFDGIYFAYNWDSLFYCGLYASCGNCRWAWIQSILVAPSAIGKALALRHHLAKHEVRFLRFVWKGR